MAERRYLKVLFLGIAAWVGLFLAFTWIIDPYGVSPVRVAWHGINEYKPKRLDIDRLIKPYEVWRYQPRSVFLGTSRIHQSIDPAVLEGTRYAPAYNASIPASTLSENVAHLEQFFRLNGNIKHVFIEVFVYNFILPQPNVPSKPLSSFVLDAASLLFSTDALFASMQTVGANRANGPRAAYVTSNGYWTPPWSLRTADTFNAALYINEIMRIHKNISDMIIQPSAIAALDRIADLCRRNGAELHLIVTPNYPWDDYRLLSLGYWHLVEQLIRRLSTYDNVISFSQYNSMLIEPAGPSMRWWYDPLHVSREMGRAMLLAFIGDPEPDMPSNLMRRVTPETVAAVIRERRAGLEAWTVDNQSFATAFDRAKVATGNDRKRSR